jgi:predicted small secreted protein
MKPITAPLSALLLVTLAACNTVQGAGEDVEAGGEAITETAREAEQEISE